MVAQRVVFHDVFEEGVIDVFVALFDPSISRARVERGKTPLSGGKKRPASLSENGPPFGFGNVSIAVF